MILSLLTSNKTSIEREFISGNGQCMLVHSEMREVSKARTIAIVIWGTKGPIIHSRYPIYVPFISRVTSF